MSFNTAFWSQFPPEHLAAMESARPGASISTDAFGTTVTLPRTYKPPENLLDKSVRNIVLPDNPLSKMYCTIFAKPNEKIIDRGKVPVFVDGACKRNGQPNAKAGLGVFFGPGSPHNFSEPIPSTSLQTSQRAEILAAARAVKDFQAITMNDFSVNTLVLITDSSYLVRAMTDQIHDWKENRWIASNGKPVVNRADFEALDEALDYLQYEVGIDVKFWLVKKEDNVDADSLAFGCLYLKFQKHNASHAENLNHVIVSLPISCLYSWSEVAKQYSCSNHYHLPDPDLAICDET
ncbi:ribonuclease H-like domain-containing protein [Flagelloscypha sp. PMI_526]|nr:ribonuclease H-like domain-containing protein [Flagelloscypha sp. PMI_526]